MGPTMSGRLVSCVPTFRGDELSIDHASGATVLQVDQVTDFDDAGKVAIAGVEHVYGPVDRTAHTVTVTPGLAAAAEVGTELVLLDAITGKTVTVYKGRLEDGTRVEVDPTIATQLEQTVRRTGAESVAYRRDAGDRLVVTEILGQPSSHGAMTYMEGGFTTRRTDADPGVDYSAAGIFAYAPGGDPTVIMEAATGNVAMIGEFGTALPGDIGIFMFKVSDSVLGETRTRPVLQFNVGATRDQPSIQADTGLASGLMLYSGAQTNEREATLQLHNGQIYAAIESAADSESYDNYIWLKRDTISMRAPGAGTSSQVGVMRVDDGGGKFGYEITTGGFRGLAAEADAYSRVYSLDGLEVVNTQATAWRAVVASAFTVGSDRRLKKDIAAPGQSAVSILRQAPAYQWRYDTPDGEPEEPLHYGPLAEDLPDHVAPTLDVAPSVIDPDGEPVEHFAQGAKVLDLAQMVGLLTLAVQELDLELDKVPALRPTKPNRKARVL